MKKKNKKLKSKRFIKNKKNKSRPIKKSKALNFSISKLKKKKKN